jgi:hypothetical protein
MERDVPETPGPASPPDPPQDQPGKTAPVPEYIAALLYAVGILLGYGRHLLDTIHHRAAAPTFPTIAACFGTANLATILAHLNRGILRAEALQRMLLARAATGRDIDFVERRTRTPEPQPAPAAEPEQPAAAPPAPRKRASRPAAWDDPELFMPTAQDLDRQVRRRPVGRTIYDICSDLGVVPAFCHSGFWNQLHEMMHFLGGSIVRLMQEKTARRDAFIKQQDRILGSNWDWVNLTGDAFRQVLGFFIGEPPVNPFDPAAAPATGPP